MPRREPVCAEVQWRQEGWGASSRREPRHRRDPDPTTTGGGFCPQPDRAHRGARHPGGPRKPETVNVCCFKPQVCGSLAGGNGRETYAAKTFFLVRNYLRVQDYPFGNTILGSAMGLVLSEELGIGSEPK